MQRKRLFRELYQSYLLLALLSLLAFFWYATHTVERFYYEHTATELKTKALLAGRQILSQSLPLNTGQVDAFCKDFGREFSTRITVILPSGEVIGDSACDPAKMDNHADRPEVMEALGGGIGVSTRYSHLTLKQDMLYVAVPLKRDGKILAAIRTALPEESIRRDLEPVYTGMLWMGAFILIIVAAVSLYIPKRISRQLQDMKACAERFAGGELKCRLPLLASEEIGSLSEAMNKMASQLGERVHTVMQQRNEREAILSSMLEGVLAVDMGEHLISMNQAAARIFEIDPEKAKGRSIHEVIRNMDLLKLVAQTLASGRNTEGDITLHKDDGECFLQAHGMVLRDAEGNGIGAVVVLNDITRIRRLENIRRDFVANVSHELKTPITTVKGFVETLQEGALKVPDKAEKFLGIISKQVNRLDAIVADLLLLARIEESTEKTVIALEEAPVIDVLRAAIQDYEAKAAEKDIKLELDCPEELKAKINPPLLEQAVANLIDNAINYSEPQHPIRIAAALTDAETVISVSDKGCGIGKEHLERIFERFYRVDGARSRQLGGTGLGLSIVKHIAQAHGGYVTVESAVGSGSTFSIHLFIRDDTALLTKYTPSGMIKM